MNKLDMNLFAFVAWLEQNRHAHSENRLTINDGYEWYNYMWNIWLKNSDAGKEIMNGGMNIIPDNTDENITTDKNTNHPRWTSTTTWDKLDMNNVTRGKINMSALRETITNYLNDVDSYGDDKQLRESIDVLHDFVLYIDATDENGEVNVAKWGDFIIQ
jgi:hypothetical protein